MSKTTMVVLVGLVVACEGSTIPVGQPGGGEGRIEAGSGVGEGASGAYRVVDFTVLKCGCKRVEPGWGCDWDPDGLWLEQMDGILAVQPINEFEAQPDDSYDAAWGWIDADGQFEVREVAEFIEGGQRARGELRIAGTVKPGASIETREHGRVTSPDDPQVDCELEVDVQYTWGPPRTEYQCTHSEECPDVAPECVINACWDPDR